MDLVSKVMNEYPYLTMGEAQTLVDRATGIYYRLRYPCEPNACPETHPIDTFRKTQDVLMICSEIAQRNGFNSAIGYRENGISFEYDSAWLSQALINSIKPQIGVI